MNFQISALPAEQFAHLFGLEDSELAAQNIKRMTVTDDPGFPCRVSLQDAEVGESVLLLNYEHQPTASPYRAGHAIFVRENSQTAEPAVNEVPTSLRERLLSVRGFDAAGMMQGADVCEGADLESILQQLFSNEAVEYVHLHNARPGCYAATARRV